MHPTVHASCVLVGRQAVLIRGPSGSGKSSLALALLNAAREGILPPSWLVADDRVHLQAVHGRLLARAPETLGSRIEVRGAGIREVTSEPLARVSLVVDLAASDAARMPDEAAMEIELLGVKLSRVPVSPGQPAIPPVLAALNTVTKPSPV